MKQGVLLLVAALAGGCGTPLTTMPPSGRSPDAVVVTGSSHGDHMLAVTRPTFWQAHNGSTLVDERITLAVVDIDAACWRLAARLNDVQAIELAAALESTLIDLPAGSPQPILCSVEAMGAVDVPVVVPGGRWHVERMPNAVDLQLVDGQGQVLAHVQLGALAVEDLQRRLERFARMRG